MTDEQALYATLVVLYVAECAAWVPRGAAAFVARGAAGARLRFSARSMGNSRGGLVLGDVLPGRAGTFIVPQWPLSLGRRGVLGWVAESLERDERAVQTDVFHSWADIDAVAASGRSVTARGDVLWAAPTGATAAAVASAVERIRVLPEGEREAAIAALIAAQMDTDAIRRRLAEFERETGHLRTAAGLLAVTVLAGAPIVVHWAGFERTWPLLFGVAYLLGWVVTALFARAHRRLGLGSRLSRWGHSALLALLPISAMRAPDVLARSVLHGFHPLAVAYVLVPREQAIALAAHLARDLREPRRPVCLSSAKEAIETEADYRAALRSAVERLIADHGVEPSALVRAPAPDEGCVAYCPRCLAQYGPGVGVCGDCGGVPLTGLSPPPVSRHVD